MASLYRRNGSRVWWLRFQLNGVRVQRSARTTRRSEAMRVLARTMENERQRQEAKFIKVPFGTLCDEYCSQHLATLKPRSRTGYLGHIRSLNARLGNKYIDGVGKTDIADLVASYKREGLKPPTIRRYLSTLSSLMAFAERSGWIADNPVRRFDKRSLPEATPRTRYLSGEEYDRLVTVAPAHLKPIIQIAVLTGMRLEELLSLKWSQIDLARREIRLENTKNNRPRVVPLADSAVAIFVATRGSNRKDGYVFTNPATARRYRRLKRSFDTACRKAGIQDLRFHDLRHTFASWAVQSGMDLYRLSRILGHASLQMTTRYAHLATDHLHEAMRAMATSLATRSSDTSSVDENAAA